MKKSAQMTVPRLLLAPPLVLVIGLLIFAQQPAKAPAPTQSSTPAPKEISARANEILIDSSIPDDPDVSKMLTAFSPRVRDLDSVVGALKGELRRGGMGAGSIGNFVADGMRAQASLKLGKPVTLAMMNAGGIRRSSIGEGELRARDLYELLPFENALLTLDLTGAQLKTLLEMITASREAESGAKIVYENSADNRPKLVSIKLRGAGGEKDLDPNASYTIVTIDYLYRVGGERYAVLREGKNVKELGITLRDAIINYVKSETAAGRVIKPNLDGRFTSNSPEAPPND